MNPQLRNFIQYIIDTPQNPMECHMVICDNQTLELKNIQNEIRYSHLNIPPTYRWIPNRDMIEIADRSILVLPLKRLYGYRIRGLHVLGLYMDVIIDPSTMELLESVCDSPRSKMFGWFCTLKHGGIE